MQYQLPLLESYSNRDNGNANKLSTQDRPIHDWFRFVLAFPPHLVRKYLEEFSPKKDSVVLDPFCGTGTTLIESKFRGFSSIGIEANLFAHFSSQVKVNWEIDPDTLLKQSIILAEIAAKDLEKQGISDQTPFLGDIDALILQKLSEDENKLILSESISPLPLHKTLTLLNIIKQFQQDEIFSHQLLALSNALVNKISNLSFGPEVGVAKIKFDVPVISTWLSEIEKMAGDLKFLPNNNYPDSRVVYGDSRLIDEILPESSIDIVITSPPYPNEKDYTRITRLESVVLGFINNRSDLRLMKNSLIRSNTRNVYRDDDDDEWIKNNNEVNNIAEEIEARRIKLGKTSGFERQYAKVTKLYFGGMARHLASLRKVLKPGARLAYVVGDQSSYLRVMIRTGKILGDIAQGLGYEVVRTDLFRTRLATATKEQLREEVIILRWKG